MDCLAHARLTVLFPLTARFTHVVALGLQGQQRFF